MLLFFGGAGMRRLCCYGCDISAWRGGRGRGVVLLVVVNGLLGLLIGLVGFPFACWLFSLYLREGVAYLSGVHRTGMCPPPLQKGG